MALKDWTLPPLSQTPGDLRPALADARLAAVDHDRARRTLGICFTLPPEAGVEETTFLIEEPTHLELFAYLPPAAELNPDLPPEEALARAGVIARQGLITTLDPMRLPEGLVVVLASLHPTEDAVTLTAEGFGEDPDIIVWWELRASGIRLGG